MIIAQTTAGTHCLLFFHVGDVAGYLGEEHADGLNGCIEEATLAVEEGHSELATAVEREDMAAADRGCVLIGIV